MYRIAIVVNKMSGYGAERSVLSLADHFSKSGYEFDLVVQNYLGELLLSIPPSVNVCIIDNEYRSRKRVWKCSHPNQKISFFTNEDDINLSDLIRFVMPNWPLGFKVLPRRKNRYVRNSNLLAAYINSRLPDVMMTALPDDFICGLLARAISRKSFPIVCSIRCSVDCRPRSLAHLVFSKKLDVADRVHTISDGLRSHIIANRLCQADRVRTIYNLAARKEITHLAKESIQMPWRGGRWQ